MDKASSVSDRLVKLGFDIPRLHFAMRTALASGLAMALAWMLGLEHPQWSAMTVWAVSQPVRGMLLEKSLFRGLGTIVGTLFGVVLVLLAGDNLPVLVICLALWVGLCVGLGNLLHGLISYGTLLSGYSASMVALLNTQQPVGQVFLLGTDRLLTVMTGIVVGLVVGLIFAPRRAESQLTDQVRQTTAELLQAMAARFTAANTSSRAEASHSLLKDIALTEQLFEIGEAGSLRNHRSTRALRAVVQAQVGCVFWIRNSRNLPQNESLAAALEQAAQTVYTHAAARKVIPHLEAALAFCAEDEVTAEVIRSLLDSLREYAALDNRGATSAVIRNRVVLHRDWVGARHAMLRATGLLLAVGAVWVATGWAVGAYVMLGVSVMIALFSTFETPSHVMGHIFVWQLIAAGAALCCHWLIWPHATSEWQLIATLIPFVMAIIPFYAHQRFMTGSIDYVMALLLLSHPQLPLNTSFSTSLSTAAAVVAGPLLAYITFKTVWPADARRRRIRLTDMMIGELVDMATQDTHRNRRTIWQARLYHRVLKLVQSVSRTAEPLQPVTDGSLAVLAVGNAILELQEIRQQTSTHQPHTPGTLRRVGVALKRLQRLQRLRQRPEQVARTLQQLASHLWRIGHPAAWEVENAARSLQANSEFFHRG